METQAEMAGAVFGRGMAAIIMTFFGFLWLLWGFSVIEAAAHVPTALWSALFVVAAVLMTFTIAMVRRGRALMKAKGTSRREYWSQRGKPFRIVTILEVLGVIIVIVLANIFHRPDWIPVGISFVVGLHFIPLGSVFGFPGYYFVGGAICAWDIVSVTAFRSADSGAFAALGTGVILWAMVIGVLVRSARKLVNP